TSCFIVCYSIANRTSFDNVKSKWLGELNRYGKHVSKLLVGTKLDLRIPNSKQFVNTVEGERLAKKIGDYKLRLYEQLVAKKDTQGEQLVICFSSE
ncbi:hypothetical protein PSTG_19736, partial [Puccinia striiformis f. sp. tritici PST-78]